MARRALAAQVPPEQRMQVPVCLSRGLATPNKPVAWEPVLRRHLEDMVKAESLVGIQVAVWQGRSVLIDVAAGKMGPLDPRPVQPNTLFPCYSVSRVATASVVHTFVRAGQLSKHRDNSKCV